MPTASRPSTTRASSCAARRSRARWPDRGRRAGRRSATGRRRARSRRCRTRSSSRGWAASIRSGRADAGDGARVDAGGDGRAAGLGLHDERRPLLRLPDRRSARWSTCAVAPCSPFSVSRDLMRESAARARTASGCTRTAPRTTTTSPTAASTSARRRPSTRPSSSGSAATACMRTASARRARHRSLRAHRHRRRALSLQQHAARLGDRAGAPDARRRRAGRSRRRRQRQQRRRESARLGAPGDAARARRWARDGRDRAVSRPPPRARALACGGSLERAQRRRSMPLLTMSSRAAGEAR